MHWRQKALLSAITLVVLALPGGAAGDARVMPPGTSVGGVDVSSLTVDAAAARLSSVLGAPLARNVVVGAGGRQFQLSPTQAKVRFDAPLTARRAYDAAVAHSRAPVPPLVDHSHADVQAFVASVAHTVDRAGRDARLRITVGRLYVRRSGVGHRLDAAALTRQVDDALDSPSLPRVLHVRLQRAAPRLDARGLAHKYATVITIDRAHFRLRLFKHLRRVKTYPIAVGRAGLETPRGYYHVSEREVNPPWHVPNRSWAGALAGHTIPGGAPENPLKARWLGLADGIGIHGTAESFSIGSRASHGCIRMRIPDVIALYRRVPLATTVYIR